MTDPDALREALAEALRDLHLGGPGDADAILAYPAVVVALDRSDPAVGLRERVEAIDIEQFYDDSGSDAFNHVAYRDAVLAALAGSDPEIAVQALADIVVLAALASSEPAGLPNHPDDGHPHLWGCRRCGVDQPAGSEPAGLREKFASGNYLQMYDHRMNRWLSPDEAVAALTPTASPTEDES